MLSENGALATFEDTLIMKKSITFIAGFLILFFVYHFPEFFQPFWITAVFKIGFLAVAIILCRLQGWKRLDGYGLAFVKNWYTMLFIGLLAGYGAYVLSIVTSIGLYSVQLQYVQSFRTILYNLPLTLVITFFPSIAEDILTRGYLYGHLKHLKPAVWIALSSAIYVLNHIWRLDDGLPVLSYLLLLGLVLAICVWAKRSLWLALGIHWGANIAFEQTNAALSLSSEGNPDASNWSLSLVWGIVLVILIIIYRRGLTPEKDK